MLGIRARFATIAEIARCQHGRVSREQLMTAGVDRSRIGRWLDDGRLLRVHRGVYAVGHVAPSLHGDLMAAALACGRDAVVSHASAARVYKVIRTSPALPEVTVPTSAHRKRPGIAIHRVLDLHPLDATSHHGIPITTVPRVLLDLAPRLTPPSLTRACHEAWIRHRTSSREIEACITRNATKKGADKLRRALGADVTLSGLEDEFLALLRLHGLPEPRTNIDQAGDKVDCRWPERGVTVELLSFRYHATRHAFEQDVARRRRSNHIAYTYGDVFERATRTAAELRGILIG